MTEYVLEVIAGDHVGARFPLDGAETTLGRDRANVVCLDDWGISRRHARLLPTDGGWVLEDLGSKNGVLVNGILVSRHDLKPGDEFALGKARLRFAREISTREEGGTAANSAGAGREAEAKAKDRGSGGGAADDTGAFAVPAGAEAEDCVSPSTPPPAADETEVVAGLREAREVLLTEIGKVVIGQHEVVEQLLTALFSRGHCLMVGVPGLAKTLMVRTLAKALELDDKRIQFTPDLMPSDITGTQILEEDQQTGRRALRFVRGPIFTNILLADEINRTPPKTQAALLEAMQEGRVTAGGTSYRLDKPFFVLATQNPIEQEGTYPLPEAQLDRFMFMVKISYPSRGEEMEIYRATTGDMKYEVQPVLSGEAILRLQKIVRRVPVSDHVTAYVADLVRATRPEAPEAPDFVKEWLGWGAGPRAGQYLLLAAKARAILHGRMNVSCRDVRAVAHPVLRHRLFCNFNAAGEGVDSDAVVSKLLETVREPSEKDYKA